MTKRELEDELLKSEDNYRELHSENSRLQYNLDQYQWSNKDYLRQIAKLKITNKKLREKLKLAKSS